MKCSKCDGKGYTGHDKDPCVCTWGFTVELKSPKLKKSVIRACALLFQGEVCHEVKRPGPHVEEDLRRQADILNSKIQETGEVSEAWKPKSLK